MLTTKGFDQKHAAVLQERLKGRGEGRSAENADTIVMCLQSRALIKEQRRSCAAGAPDGPRRGAG